MPGSFIEQRLEGGGLGRWQSKQSKKAINLTSISWNGKPQAEDVNFFLPVITGGQGPEQRHFFSTVRQRGRTLWGRPLWIIIITGATESKSTHFQHGAILALPCNTINHLVRKTRLSFRNIILRFFKVSETPCTRHWFSNAGMLTCLYILSHSKC